MAVPAPSVGSEAAGRIRETVALLERRGFALPPGRLAALCLGGQVSEAEVLEAGPQLAEGLVVSDALRPRSEAIRRRQLAHEAFAGRYLTATARFARRLATLFPFVLHVSVAGSLASGGFLESDDVDLNLIVADGTRHLAYVALNLLGVLDAVGRRGKPVDTHTARPLAPRVMTANLILELSQCFPLLRQDADMAYELLASRPLVGAEVLEAVLAANPALGAHFPQLVREPSRETRLRRLPGWLFPGWLEAPARIVGRAAWGYMMWTRRSRPEALARVAFVRSTMRPYALFEDP
ncbi:MAG: hypothetical protein NVS9B1_25270 [Candidatus Dormibacteraceae bacterium]